MRPDPKAEGRNPRVEGNPKSEGRIKCESENSENCANQGKDYGTTRPRTTDRGMVSVFLRLVNDTKNRPGPTPAMSINLQ